MAFPIGDSVVVGLLFGTEKVNVMLDDLLAGLYTLAVLHSVRWGLM